MTGRRVLVGVDGSANSTQALRWAVHNHQPGDRITIMLAWDYPPTIWMAPPFGTELPSKDTQLEAATETLKKVIAEIDTADVELEQVVEFGSPANVILSRQDDADLIVVGTRGSGLSRILLGSVSRRILHHAKIPVVVVPEGAPLDYSERVVVGIDGSENSIAALRWARGLETKEICAILAWHIPSLYAPEVVILPVDLLEDSANKQAEQTLNEALAGETDDRIVALTRHGDGRSALVDSGLEPGLIVVGSRGRTGFTGAILGSVATYVAAHSTVAVAVIPHD